MLVICGCYIKMNSKTRVSYRHISLVCVHVQVCVSMYVSVYMWVHIYEYVCASVNECVQACVCERVCVCGVYVHKSMEVTSKWKRPEQDNRCPPLSACCCLEIGSHPETEVWPVSSREPLSLSDSSSARSQTQAALHSFVQTLAHWAIFPAPSLVPVLKTRR